MNNVDHCQSTRRCRLGMTLVEVILAVALFSLFATALIGLVMMSYNSSVQAWQKQQATLYADEGLDAVLAIRRQAWDLLVNGQYGLSNASGHWQLAGTADALDNSFTRTITIADACRDANSVIVDCGRTGAAVDLRTKKVTSTVTYVSVNRAINTNQVTSYITTWQSKDWTQMDWSGGPGQSVWTTGNRFAADDGHIDYSTNGEIKLASLGNGCGGQTWSFSNPADFIFDPNSIEVTGGFAQLKSQGAPLSGSTLNSGFTTDTANWQFGKWGTANTNVTGQRQANNGNPGGWVNINIPKSKNTQVGGYWSQAFTTTVSNPTVTLNFDSQVTAYAAAPVKFVLYVFVDATAGQPVIGSEVWNSGAITSTRGWASPVAIDASSRIRAAGTYYLKIAVWVQTPNSNIGPFTIGYDNVRLNWNGSGSGFAANKPTIMPSVSSRASGIDRWSSFTENATKNGGEIYYQLSDNDGSTWKYWNGLSWVTAGSSNYNTAGVINSGIGSFPTSTGKIRFKAFLASDGSQQVKLDQLAVSCAQQHAWQFDLAADYAFDANKIAVASGAAQLKPQQTPMSGATLNSGFDTNTADWQFSKWGTASTRVTGDRQSSSGNPGGWVYISIPKSKNTQVGGYWSQTFTTTADHPTVLLNFDWWVSQYNARPNSLRLYVFVDSSPGAPTAGQEVWNSGEITAATNWSTQTAIDASSRVGNAGTYYIKIAALVQTPSSNTGPFTLGFDNVSLAWSGFSASYPSDQPTIQPSTSLAVSSIDQWSGFFENATKNGGEIYYQLSDNDGSTWKYWNGSSWASAGSANYNTADVINSGIGSFPTSTGKIRFKAFLASDGSQQISLDQVSVGFGKNSGGGQYATAGWLESAAFSTGGSSFNLISWSEILPSAATDIQVQLATAPDQNGSPGPWSPWMGISGANSFYGSGDETVIPAINGHNDAQWVKYKVWLSGDGNSTPTLQNITVNYTP